MHPHNNPSQSRYVPHSANHSPPTQPAHPGPATAPSQLYPHHPYQPFQNGAFRQYISTGTFTQAASFHAAATTQQTSSNQTSAPSETFRLRDEQHQHQHQHRSQHPQHPQHPQYLQHLQHPQHPQYSQHSQHPQHPQQHVTSREYFAHDPVSQPNSTLPAGREAPHAVPPPQQTVTVSSAVTEQMLQQRDAVIARAIQATHQNVVEMLCVIQREQVNLRDRLALKERSHEGSASQDELRSLIVSSFQNLDSRLDRIETAIGKEPELPPGSKAVGTDKSLKDRLRSAEGIILELLDKTSTEILRSRNPRPAPRAIPSVHPPPPPPPVRVDVGVQVRSLTREAAADVHPPHGVEVSVQTVPIPVQTRIVIPPQPSRSEAGVQASSPMFYHPVPPQHASSFPIPSVATLNSRFPSSPLSRDTMRPAEWSREGSDIDEDSPRFSGPLIPPRSIVRLQPPVTPTPPSRKRTVATQTPSRAALVEEHGSSRTKTASVAIGPTIPPVLPEVEPFSPSQYIRSPSPVHRTTANPNLARIAQLQREVFGDITTENMLQGPLPPQFTEHTHYTNSSFSGSGSNTRNASPATSDGQGVLPEMPDVYLDEIEPRTNWEGDVFDGPTPVIESVPLPLTSPAPVPAATRLLPSSPPPVLGRKRSRSFSSLSSLSDTSPLRHANRPRVISEEPSVVSTTSAPISQGGKPTKKRRTRSSLPVTTKKRQSRKRQKESEPRITAIPVIEVFNPDVECEWPDVVEGVEPGMSVQCSGCHAWYHLGCAGIDENDECLKPENDFFCPPCEKTREIHGRTRKLETIDDSYCARPDCAEPALANAGSEVYTVEYIIGRQPHHGTDGKKYLWLVKWEGYTPIDASWIQDSDFSNGTPDHMIPVFERKAVDQGHDPSIYSRTILLKEALDWGWR